MYIENEYHLWYALKSQSKEKKIVILFDWHLHNGSWFGTSNEVIQEEKIYTIGVTC